MRLTGDEREHRTAKTAILSSRMKRAERSKSEKKISELETR